MTFEYKKIKALIFITSFFVLAVFILPIPAGAGAKLVNSTKSPSSSQSGASLPFGGRVVAKVQCTCSAGSQVTITGGQFSGTYLDTGGAQSFARYYISPGRNILAKYTPGGQCLMAGEPCTTLPITKGTITMFGVSF
ncbi:MAG: hypothetical protein QG566_142 [Patescibacteria group bacterium]|jgi:hypothetical protein|nr:hypothetical protein [Patescibacteria group bacterium]